LTIFGKIVLVLKDRILGNAEFQKTGNYETGRPDCLGLSRREVKIDVWKYLKTIVMGLYAVCEEKLDNQHRALRHRCIDMMMITFVTINSGLVPLTEGLYAQI